MKKLLYLPDSQQSGMKHRKLTALFCVLAYLVGFAHSAIAHEHHLVCHLLREQTKSECTHSYHYGSCEQLNTFLASEDGSLTPLFFQLFSLCAAVVPDDSGFLHDRHCVHIVEFFYSVGFTDPPLRGEKGLRAPPVDL